MALYGDKGFVIRPPSSDMNQIWCAFRCDNCSALSIATRKASLNDGLSMTNPAAWIELQSDAEWYPIRATGKDFDDVPQHIAEAASEAYKCRSISAFRAAVLLARSVIEAAAKDKGITQGNLISKINTLFDQGYIREYIRDGAHEVRFLGNEMAHGDFIIPVNGEETNLTLILMSEILEEVYQSPARVSRARAARAARQTPPPTEQSGITDS
jgi:hypothetical protein